jgi:hypothetical protein
MPWFLRWLPRYYTGGFPHSGIKSTHDCHVPSIVSRFFEAEKIWATDNSRNRTSDVQERPVCTWWEHKCRAYLRPGLCHPILISVSVLRLLYKRNGETSVGTAKVVLLEHCRTRAGFLPAKLLRQPKRIVQWIRWYRFSWTSCFFTGNIFFVPSFNPSFLWLETLKGLTGFLGYEVNEKGFSAAFTVLGFKADFPRTKWSWLRLQRSMFPDSTVDYNQAVLNVQTLLYD